MSLHQGTWEIINAMIWLLFRLSSGGTFWAYKSQPDLFCLIKPKVVEVKENIISWLLIEPTHTYSHLGKISALCEHHQSAFHSVHSVVSARSKGVLGKQVLRHIAVHAIWKCIRQKCKMIMENKSRCSYMAKEWWENSHISMTIISMKGYCHKMLCNPLSILLLSWRWYFMGGWDFGCRVGWPEQNSDAIGNEPVLLHLVCF